MHHHIVDCHSSARGLLDHLLCRLRGAREEEEEKQEEKQEEREEGEEGEDERSRSRNLFQNAETPLSVSSRLLVRAEDVEGQRFLPLIDEADGIVHVADGHYGQHGAKDLLLHQPGVGWHILQHRRRCGENGETIDQRHSAQ